jgi:8-oxo-dGTP diphosphatase
VTRPDWRRFRTVRCILKQDDRFLLVVHHQRFPGGRTRWGLPGGRIERGEDLATTARRELREELSVHLADLHEVGDYRYKGALNRVYACEFAGRILSFDRSELRQIAWHTFDDVVELAAKSALHAGFEATAIGDYLELIGGHAP